MAEAAHDQQSTLALDASRRAAADEVYVDALARPALKRALARMDAVRAALRPSELLGKQLEALDPALGLKEMLARTDLPVALTHALRPLEFSVAQQVRRQMESALSLRGALAGLDAALFQRSKEVEAMLAPSRLASKYLEEVASGKAFRLVVEQADRWRQPYSVLAKSLERLNEPIEIASVRTLLEGAAQASASNRFVEIEASWTQETQQRVVEVIHDIAARAEAQLTLQGAVDQIVLALQENKEPLYQKLLVAVLVPFVFLLLGTVLNPMGDFFVKRRLESSSPQAATKAVKEAAKDAVGDVRVLGDYRFVSAKQLWVTTTAKARAPVLGQLRFGQVVRVIEKKRDFTLIVWMSEDGKTELRGWVFSRYLRRFQ